MLYVLPLEEKLLVFYGQHIAKRAERHLAMGFTIRRAGLSHTVDAS